MCKKHHSYEQSHGHCMMTATNNIEVDIMAAKTAQIQFTLLPGIFDKGMYLTIFQGEKATNLSEILRTML